jgi:hypothetical protein
MVVDTPAAKKSQKKNHYKNEMSPPKLDSGCLSPSHKQIRALPEAGAPG